MRQIKIAKETKNFELSNVPENLKFVEKIAKQYSLTKEELEHFYLIGLKAFENLESNNKNASWILRQAILEDQARKHSS